MRPARAVLTVVAAASLWTVGCATSRESGTGGSGPVATTAPRVQPDSNAPSDCFTVGKRVSAIDADASSFTGVGRQTPTWGVSESVVRQPYVVEPHLPPGARPTSITNPSEDTCRLLDRGPAKEPTLLRSAP